MEFNVCVVKDAGDKWIAQYVIKNTLMNIDFSEHYVKCSYLTCDKINEELQKGNLILLPKGIERELVTEDLEIIETDKLDNAKNIAKYRISCVLNYYLESLSIIDIYAYTAIFSKFASRGIFITDENVDKVKELYTIDKESIKDRDEAYVNIIMENSKEDLEDLQVLVDSQDKMKRVYDLYKRIHITEDKIESCTTEEEIEEITNTFIKNFVFPN